MPYLFKKSFLIYAIRFGFMSRSRSKATALEYMGPMNMSWILVVILWTEGPYLVISKVDTLEQF